MYGRGRPLGPHYRNWSMGMGPLLIRQVFALVISLMFPSRNFYKNQSTCQGWSQVKYEVGRMKRRKSKMLPMASVASAYLLLLLMVSAPSTADARYDEGGQCPTGCFCANDDREVDCSSRGLTHVPKSLPRRTEQLWVKGRGWIELDLAYFREIVFASGTRVSINP